MAANVTIACPTCGQEYPLRFDPGPEDDAPSLAAAQLEQECPDHTGPWRFWPTPPTTEPDD
jgi:hypothetical protein